MSVYVFECLDILFGSVKIGVVMNILVTAEALRAVIWALEYELTDIKADPTHKRRYGICKAVNDVFKIRNLDWRMKMIILEAAFRTWPEFSGSITHPVKCPEPLGPNTKENAVYAYNYFNDSGMAWNPMCEYGRSRIRLAKHIIAECEKQLKDMVDTDFARV